MFRKLRRSDSGEVVAFAFSGGGVRGASQVGMLKALTEAGIMPQMVAGSSVGAVNAVHAALHPQRVDHLEEIWSGLHTRDVFPGNKARIVMNMARSGSIFRADMWEATLRMHLGEARFEDLSIACAAIAVRLRDGERVVFDSGPLLPALMASSSIPGVFPPYRIEDEYYVDGGLLEFMPLPTLIERGATTIFGPDTSYVSEDFSETRRIIERSARIAARAWLRRQTSLAATRGRTIHLLTPALPELGSAQDFRRTGELIQAGYLHTKEYLRSHGLARSDATPERTSVV